MAEKAPLFTVTDRRKFTPEGDFRPGVVASEVPPTPAPEASPAAVAAPAPAAESSNTAASVATQPSIAETTHESDEANAAYAGEDEGALPEPTAAEAAEQHAAYKESSRSLDELIARQNPRSKAPGDMTFDRLVQSVYMTAALQLGAGGQPGEQPRVDILGARQSIDMLSVLKEKTKGNLTPNEERLLQNALFELRMSFLEITNAIASAAQEPMPPGAPAGLGARPGPAAFSPGRKR